MDNRQAEFEISSKKYFEREEAISEIDVELERAEAVLSMLMDNYGLNNAVISKEQLMAIELEIDNIRVLLEMIYSLIRNGRKITRDNIDNELKMRTEGNLLFSVKRTKESFVEKEQRC